MTSRLAEIQARFQQKQMQEKEEKLLKLYENQQQRAIERVSRGSAGSNSSVGSTGGGKVRQMFDERRQKAGVDRSYPLEPLKSRTNRGGSVDRKTNRTSSSSRTTVMSTVQKSVGAVKNGKHIVSKREVVHNTYNINDGNESYEEHKFQEAAKADLFNSNSHREIIEMMNNHNIDEVLDNEVMPKIRLDEDHNGYSSTESSNFVTKPEQNGVKKSVGESKPLSSPRSNAVTSVRKKTTNPAPNKSVRSTPPTKFVPSPASSPRTSTPTSPSKSSSTIMQSRSSTPSARAPSNTRPSAKQSVKSPVVRDDLAECNFCGRRFAADRLQKHEDICSKTGKKKRKAYDATKHRVVGTELEGYVLKGTKGKSGASSRSTKSASKKDWRKTHEEFIAAIRAAKQTQAHLAKGGKLSDLPPPPPSSNPDYVQCPHCGRRFNQSAAERHIPKCATFQFNKPKPGMAKPPGRR